jgi:hypothetical protein
MARNRELVRLRGTTPTIIPKVYILAITQKPSAISFKNRNFILQTTPDRRKNMVLNSSASSNNSITQQISPKAFTIKKLPTKMKVSISFSNSLQNKVYSMTLMH